MKTQTLVLLVVVILALVALSLTSLASPDSNRAWKIVKDPYPTTGMTTTDLAVFAKELTSLSPTGLKVIELTFRDENTVIIHTGKRNGALDGSGEIIVYEKQKGRWTEIGRFPWRS
jgi:hypothetical protein